MNVFGFFIGTVFAFEGIISPLPDNFVYIQPDTGKPTVAFQALPIPVVLGTSTRENPVPTPILIDISPVPTATIDRTTSSTPTGKTRQKNMTIAIIGDSMVDTFQDLTFPN